MSIGIARTVSELAVAKVARWTPSRSSFAAVRWMPRHYGPSVW
ncbi:hypothetical protein [Kitasatospora herbaricolor]|uniref:Uncharacterized protein n=1 Tax=Kitasatospora herbaricolor TaxID=68217 RepID=A0ABZ1W320_9ACTN|nr:hypothetical protein [Kitasatospora herbaricolor]